MKLRLAIFALLGLGLLCANVSLARALDGGLIWLAAGAHGAPCRIAKHCADGLVCDITSDRCLNAPRIEGGITVIEGCAPYLSARYWLLNSGELPITRSILLHVELDGRFYPAVCEHPPQDDWDYAHCDFEDLVEGPLGGGSDTQTVTLRPGEALELQVFPHASVPKFTLEANMQAWLDGVDDGEPSYEAHWSTNSFDPLDGTDVCY